MKTIFSVSLLLLAVSAPLVCAQVVISDDFSNPIATSTPSENITGLFPANGSTTGNFVAGTNLPGGSWTEIGGNTSDGNGVEQKGTLMLATGSSVSSWAGASHGGISAISLGSYNTSPILTISAYISPTNIFNQVGTSNGNGGTLGFTNASGSNYPGNLTGLILDGNGGLTLQVGGNTSSIPAGSETIAYSGGTFNPAQAYLLTYSINTVTGSITSISLEGSTANYGVLETESVGDFTSSDVAYAALGAGISNSFGGKFADLNVTAAEESIPEPSTWALLGLGALILCVTLRRRQLV